MELPSFRPQSCRMLETKEGKMANQKGVLNRAVPATTMVFLLYTRKNRNMATTKDSQAPRDKVKKRPPSRVNREIKDHNFPRK